MTRIEEVRQRMAALKVSLAAYESNPNPTDEDNTRGAAELTEWDALEAELAPLAAREAKFEVIRNATVEVVSGDGNSVNRDVQVKARTADDVFDLTRTQFWGMSDDEVSTELRGRALKAVELVRNTSDDVREQVTKLIEGERRPSRDEETKFRGYAEHVLRTGSETYETAFTKFLKDPYGIGLNEAERAAMSLTSANGGYLLPFVLDPTIILTNAGVENPFRQLCRVITSPQNVWHGVSSAGVTAEWLAEATEAADASPTFAQPTITCYKAAAYLQASFELLEDGNLESEIGFLLADAKDRHESAAFATGNGTTAPKGIVTALQAVTASRVAGSSGAAGAADFVLGDVYAIDNAMSPRHRPNAAWLAEKSIYNRIRRFGEGTSANNSTFWVDLGGGRPAELIGYPAHQSSAMDSTIVSGSNDDILILGNFSQYYIVDRVGMSLAYNPLVIGSSFRPTGSVGWFAHWRVGGDTVNADAFRMLRV